MSLQRFPPRSWKLKMIATKHVFAHKTTLMPAFYNLGVYSYAFEVNESNRTRELSNIIVLQKKKLKILNGRYKKVFLTKKLL